MDGHISTLYVTYVSIIERKIVPHSLTSMVLDLHLHITTCRKELEPPYKPVVTSDLDVGNIDTAFTSELPTVTPTPADAVLVDEDAFQGFTYNETER
jgi:hypothetical protein